MADDKLKQRLKQLLALPQNRLCCDCSMVGPTWASKNIGVFVCLDCAGVHRSMGTDISQVRSVDLDTWVPAWVSVMENCGNALGNSQWEARMPPGRKITPSVSKEARANFIRDKYAKKLFYSPLAEGATACAPVLSAAEQRKQARLARLNSNGSNGANSVSPQPSPSHVQQQQPQQQQPQRQTTTVHVQQFQQQQSQQQQQFPVMMDLFSGMTVKTQPSRPAVVNLFDGMSVSSPLAAPPLALSPAPSSSSATFDLLNLDAIAQDESGSSLSRSPLPQSRSEDPFAEFISL